MERMTDYETACWVLRHQPYLTQGFSGGTFDLLGRQAVAEETLAYRYLGSCAITMRSKPAGVAPYRAIHTSVSSFRPMHQQTLTNDHDSSWLLRNVAAQLTTSTRLIATCYLLWGGSA